MATNNRGFILATTLLVMTLLTVMLTAAFVMVSAEYRSTNGAYATTRALNFAQAGLQRYFSLPHTLTAGASVDSVNYAFSGGYARVVARKLRDSIAATERALWIVYSTGVDSTRSLTTQGSASRVVAQLAGLQTGAMPTPAAMVAVNGVQMTSSGGNPIRGYNTTFAVPLYSCYPPNPSTAAYDTIGLYTGGGVSGSGDPDIRGEPVNYDAGAYSNGSNNTPTDNTKSWTTNEFAGDSVLITEPASAVQRRRISSNSATTLTVSPNWTGGSPNASWRFTIFGTVRYLSASETIDTTRIDWLALVNGQFTPDFTGTLPANGNTQYQSHYFTGNVTIPSGTRRGLLVALGNVTLANNSHWDGIIVAGGRLDAGVNGNYCVHGMVITGLNIVLGSSVQANQVRRGNSSGSASCSGSYKVISWDYCYAKASIASLNYLVPIAGTFTDSWDTY